MRLGAGLLAVMRKEISDHLSSRRFAILFGLVAVTGLSAIYVAAMTIRQTAGEAGDAEFVFLRLFTTSGGSLPPFTFFVAFLGPLVGLALGFDAINGEVIRGTLSRVLAQPIHRDSLINGKFLASFASIAMVLLVLGSVVGGLGLWLIGVPPTLEELVRMGIFLALSIIYVGFWLSLSISFSVVFRQTATSALAGMAAWLLLTVFAGLLASLAADAVVPLGSDPTVAELLRHERVRGALARLSPATLYAEATLTVLTPHVRTLSPVLLEQVEGAIPGPLPLGHSLLLIWPHLTGLTAATLVFFAVSYVLFMRREIRAT